MSQLDVHTLVLVSSLILGALGVLFLVSWGDDRDRLEMRDWGVGFLSVVPGVILIGLRDRVSDPWSIGVANGAIIAAYGLVATGAMRFVGRRPWPGVAFLGSAAWGLACLHPEFFDRFDLRVILLSVLCGAEISYATLLLARQYRSEPLPSLGRSAIGLGAIAAILWTRAALMWAWPVEASGTEAIRTSWLTWMSVALLVICLITAHLLLAMSVERAGLRHRQRAETDDLTGALSRGAFDERARERLAAAPDRGTLMFFDIDRFKSINDGFGHGVGDEVLVGFARLVSARLGPSDLFARWGGEEFVLFLAEDDFVTGRRVAEEIRRDFAGLVFGDAERSFTATVSVGLSAPALAGTDLDRLVAWADAGVYAAKRAGRDRVETIDPSVDLAAVSS